MLNRFRRNSLHSNGILCFRSPSLKLYWSALQNRWTDPSRRSRQILCRQTNFQWCWYSVATFLFTTRSAISWFSSSTRINYRNSKAGPEKSPQFKIPSRNSLATPIFTSGGLRCTILQLSHGPLCGVHNLAKVFRGWSVRQVKRTQVQVSFSNIIFYITSCSSSPVLSVHNF